MDKIEYRIVIKYFVSKGLTATKIKNVLDFTLEDSAPSFSTVKKWAAEFKRGRSSIFDDKRSGRPKTATTEEIIKKIHNVVLNDRRLKLRELAAIAKISEERAYNILAEHLHLKKFLTQWVPRSLTIDQKRIRMNVSRECLDMFKHNSTNFLRRFITFDEILIYLYTPETKQSRQRLKGSESAPKKVKTVPSPRKIMAIIFWDSQGVVLIDYVEKGKTNKKYYATLLEQLNDAIKAKRPRKKRVLFHHDNAPAYTSSIAVAKLHELGFELLPHATYSPDLAPSDFFLFPNLQKWLAGKKFILNAEIITEVNTYFEGLGESYYTEGIKQLEYRWSKCIELKGDYVY